MNRIYLLVIAFIFAGVSLFSQDLKPDFLKGKNPLLKPEQNIKFSYQWQHATLKPGDNSHLALIIDLAKNYHINPPAHYLTKNDTVDLIATKIKVVKISDNAFAQSPIFQKPTSEYYELLKTNVNLYKNQTIVFVPLKAETTFKEENLSITLEVYYQMCDDQKCFMPKTEIITAEIKIGHNESSKLINENIFSQIPKESLEIADQNNLTFGYSGWKFSVDGKSAFGFLVILLISFIGGMLLNFTPCVLPIIPIKIMGLTKSAGSRKKGIFLGFILSSGVIFFWLVMGLMIISVSKFTSISTLFQYPEFTITIGVIIAVMAVGMCGLFNIQVPQKIASLNPRFNSLWGSFAIGIMTAILSTPCTAPFMGTAIAWAIKQSQLTTLVVFFVIGFGMALPYFILSSFPVLVNWMPKSGPVSVVIKETMGILMLATASYFIGVGLTSSIDSFSGSSNHWYPTMFIAAFAGVWIIIKTIQINPSVTKKSIFILLGLSIISASLWAQRLLIQEGPLTWKVYSSELFENARSADKIIVIDFTADWCPNCKALEKFVLNSEDVSTALTNQNIELLKVDISKNEASKTKLLNDEGSLTIPYLVIYKNGKKIFQSDFYSQKDILDALQAK